MKSKDLKGDLGHKVAVWVTNQINELICAEIAKYVPTGRLRNKFHFGNMKNFKKFLSGKPIGFNTHSYDEGSISFDYGLGGFGSVHCPTIISPYKRDIDIDIDTMHIEVDLEKETGSDWLKVLYSIRANSGTIMAEISEKFDTEIVKGDSIKHYDLLGSEIHVGDIVCYSTTYNNNVNLGTVEKFNACNLVADGSQIPYDADVLVVTDSIEMAEGQYKHKKS